MKRVLAFALGLISIAHADDWPTYQGNRFHSGYVSSTANLSRLEMAWETTLDFTPSYVGIAVGSGKVFIANSKRFGLSKMHALSAVDGQLGWTVEVNDVNSLNPPAFANGKVYFQTGNHSSDTFLRCHDANTGNFIFRAPHGAQWEAYLAPTIVDGTVYLNGGYYGGMYGFSGTAGDQLWFCDELAQYDGWTPAVSDTQCLTYMSNGLYVVNRSNGALAFKIEDPAYNWNGYTMGQAVALDGNFCYVTNGGRLIKFDVANRRIAWQKTRAYYGQVTIGNAALYVNDGGAVTAVNPSTGSFLWQAQSAHGDIVGPMIATDLYLIAQTESHTVMFDLDTHQEVWVEEGSGPMALADDTLYVAGATIKSYSLSGVPHELESLKLSKATVAGANSVVATVTLSTPSPNDEFVRLWDDTQLISTPMGVIIRRGGRTASTRLTTAPVSVVATRSVFAKFLTVTKVATIQLLPYGPSAMSLSPDAVVGGNPCTVRVVLNGPAPGTGQVVRISSDSPYAPVPVSVTVPGGSAEVSFMINTVRPPQPITTRIVARVNGVYIGASLLIVR